MSCECDLKGSLNYGKEEEGQGLRQGTDLQSGVEAQDWRGRLETGSRNPKEILAKCCPLCVSYISEVASIDGETFARITNRKSRRNPQRIAEGLRRTILKVDSMTKILLAVCGLLLLVVAGCAENVDLSRLPEHMQPPTCGVSIWDANGWTITDASGLGGWREDCGRPTFICDNWCLRGACDSDCDGWEDSEEEHAGSDRCDPLDTPDGLRGLSIICAVIVADLLGP